MPNIQIKIDNPFYQFDIQLDQKPCFMGTSPRVEVSLKRADFPQWPQRAIEIKFSKDQVLLTKVDKKSYLASEDDESDDDNDDDNKETIIATKGLTRFIFNGTEIELTF